MTFALYLRKLLGKEQKSKLMGALRTNKLIVVSGLHQTGKTALVDILRKHGYAAVEDFKVYNLELDTPLTEYIPDIRDIVQ